MAVNLTMGILPGLETADKLRNSRLARETQAQENMIALGNYQQEQADRELDQRLSAETLAEFQSIAQGDGRTKTGTLASEDADFGDLMTRLGERYMAAGAPKRGKEMLEAGIDYTDKVSQVSKRQYEEQKVRLENMSKAGGWVAQNIGANENEYALFLRQLEDPNNPIANIIGPDNVEVLRNTPWSPDLVNFYRSKALSIKEQADLALSERRAVNAETATENARRNAEALRQIAALNAAERKRTNDLREKADGEKASTAPTPNQLNAVKDKLRTSVRALEGISWSDRGYPTNTDVANSFDAMAQDIASEAQRIVNQDRGITFAEAVDQAIMEAEANGDFSVIEAVVRPGWIPDSAQKPGSYSRKPRAGSEASPLTLPTGDETSVARQLKKGKYYNTPMGNLRWNGTSFDQ